MCGTVATLVCFSVGVDEKGLVEKRQPLNNVGKEGYVVKAFPLWGNRRQRGNNLFSPKWTSSGAKTKYVCIFAENRL